MREVSIGENYEGKYNSHPLITFEVFERHSRFLMRTAPDADYEEFLRMGATSLFHPSGTCRMGSDSRAVEAVKFLSGSERVKDMSDGLRTAKFSQTFPDASSLKILRRGILSCIATSPDCTFVLDLPEDVRSVD